MLLQIRHISDFNIFRRALLARGGFPWRGTVEIQTKKILYMTNKVKLASVAVSAAACLFMSACAVEKSPVQKTVTAFTSRGGVVRNTGQGWITGGNENAKKDNSYVSYGGGYTRWDWSDLEPEEGKYQWKLIDDRIKVWNDAGYPFYFRVMTANYHSKTRYSTPKWVFDKGAKGVEFGALADDANVKQDPNNSLWKVKRITPDFNDPIMIAEHAKFMKALAERYDGHPGIGAIDIGSYGNWGEWHVVMLPLKDSPVEIRKKYADMYLDNFKKTPLVFMTMDDEVLEHAIGKGEHARVGLRRDGIGVGRYMGDWFNSDKYKRIKNMRHAWKDQPIIFEWINNYDVLNPWCPFRGSVDWMFENHVNLVNEGPLNPWRPKNHQHIAEFSRIDMFAGARLVLDKAVLSYEDGRFGVAINGMNMGCGRIALPYEIVFVAVDSKGNKTEFKSAVDPTKFLPGGFVIIDSFDVSKLPAGEYSVFMRIVHKGGVFKDFRCAVNELQKDGSVKVGSFRIAE